MTTSQPNRILGRTQRLTSQHRIVFDQIFGSGGGYVLNFTDRTMDEWFRETCDLEIFQPRFQTEGSSKGKTLRGFVEAAEPRLVAQVLRSLWNYRCSLPSRRHPDPAVEARLVAWYEQFVAELDTASDVPLDAAFRDFSGDTTLRKLKASIAADLLAEKPDVALDRVHTYCVKRLRHLLTSKGLPFDPETSLDALSGIYGRWLKDTSAISEFSLPLLRIQHTVFDRLNHARNKRSLAHDNQLLDLTEAQYLIESTLATLAFVERLETRSNDESP